MLEKLGIHDDITTVVKLFDLADKCAKAEEGRLFVKNEPGDPAEGSKKKKSSEKRKTTAVLAAEPDAKQPRATAPAAGPEKKDDRPFCVYHNRHSHATKDCYDLKRLREAREANERQQGCGGRGGRRWNNKYNDDYQQNPQANAAQPANDNPWRGAPGAPNATWPRPS